jgi:hypothetical protein
MIDETILKKEFPMLRITCGSLALIAAGYGLKQCFEYDECREKAREKFLDTLEKAYDWLDKQDKEVVKVVLTKRVES